MNFRPTSTLGSIIARAAFKAERNDNANHLIDRLLLLALDEPRSHATRLVQMLAGEHNVAQLRSQIEDEMSDLEPIDRAGRANVRSRFFSKIHDRLASASVIGEPSNTGHILLLVATDPTSVSGEVFLRNNIDYDRLLDAMGVLAVDEDSYLDLRLK
ncbi:MAG: hypothetical protein IIV44_03480 [Rikenellaceae bacterium]|nr:hypothetical protein [Rikenellaceae bacterium]